MPIPGTTNLEHLKENVAAVNVELTPDDLAEIEDGFSKIRVRGTRLNPELLAASDEGAKLGTRSTEVRRPWRPAHEFAS